MAEQNNQGQLGPGLSDFGLSQPSQSNSVGQDNPALSEFLKSLDALDDPATKAAALQARRKQLEAQEPTGIEDKLSNALLPLLIGGGLALGGQGGAGAALALGGLSQADLLAQEENRARADALKETRDREEESLDRIDKIHNRMNQVFLANPDAFINPETGESVLSPTLTGWLVSGAPGVPMHPETRRILDARNSDPMRGARLKLLQEGLEKANTPQHVNALLDGIENLPNGGARFSPEAREAIAATVGRPEMFDMIRDEMLKQADPESFVPAITSSIEAGVPLDSVEFLEKLTYEGTAGGDPRDQRWMELSNAIRKWETDPEAAEERNALVEEFGFLTLDYAKEAAKAVLGNSADVELYMDGITRLRREEVSIATILSWSRYIGDDADAKKMLLPMLAENLGFSQEDFAKGKEQTAAESLRRYHQANQDNYTTTMVATQREARNRYRSQIGKPLPASAVSDIWAAAERLVRSKKKIPEGEQPPHTVVRKVFSDMIDIKIERDK